METLKLKAAKKLLIEAGYAVIPVDQEAEWAVGYDAVGGAFDNPGLYIQLTHNESSDVATQIFDIKDIPQDQRR